MTPRELMLKASDGTTLYASLMLPPGEHEKGSVPLINNPYGGPHAQTVQNAWTGRAQLFDQVLAEHGFAVLHVDNRGMGGRGRDFAQAAYHNFGPIQLADQLAAMDHSGTVSGTGCEAARLVGMELGRDVYAVRDDALGPLQGGVSVAPVTDWRNYDSTYTERYMSKPSENSRSVPRLLRGDEHRQAARTVAAGACTGDDNVHLENTIQFIQKLIGAQLPYDLQLYPRKTHSIAGADARTHLYTRILAQFQAYLGEPNE